MSPAAEGTFWVVWSPSSTVQPQLMHASQAAAQRAAEGFVRVSGRTHYVMQATAKVECLIDVHMHDDVNERPTHPGWARRREP